MNDFQYCQSPLKDFANKYVGRRAFIIGNGPSLNDMDLTKLKNEITFGVNSIFYNFDKMGFKPTFYVVEDTLVAEDRAEEIKALTGMVKIFGTELQYCLQGSLDTIWANVIFDFSNYPGFPHFSLDASEALWVGGTVSYLCMQLAYYMGFSKVYLVGFDHDYSIPSDAEVDGTIITSKSDDPNHFHPEYFGKGKRWHDPRLDRMEKAYMRAKEAFEADGRKIYNATVGGNLEIFPRVNYNNLFAEQKTTFNVYNNQPLITPKPLFVNNNSNNKVRISVVVCTHRRPDYLAKVLNSLSQQTLDQRYYEVIVVDNNSQDNTKGVVDKYPPFRYVFEEQLGLSPARNTGIRAAVGDIVAFIDDDSVAEPNWLKALLDIYDKYPDTWAVGGKILLKWEAEPPEWLTEEFHINLGLRDYGDTLQQMNWEKRLAGSNCSFKKTVFSTIGYFKPELGRIGNILLSFEDADIQRRIHQTGYLVYYTPNAIVYHHVPAFRMTKQYFCDHTLGNLISNIFMELGEKGKSDKILQFLKKTRENPIEFNSQSTESVKEQLLEEIQSKFITANDDVPLDTKVKFLSLAAGYYLLQERYDKAVKNCLDGLSLPNMSQTQICKFLLRMATIYFKQDKYDQAYRVYMEALCTGQIEGLEAHQMFKAFGEYYQNQGRLSQIKRILNESLALQDISEHNKIAVTRYFCEIYLDYGQYIEAERIYLKMLSLSDLKNTSRDKLLLGLGELYTKCGRYSEARQVLNKAVELEKIIAAEKSVAQPNPDLVSCSVGDTPASPKEDRCVQQTTNVTTKPRFSHLVLDYTRLCNSRCTYCGIWRIKNGPELDLDAIERTFSSLRNFGLSTCYLTGGEPYISDKILDIASLLHRYLPKSRISGATNGVQPLHIIRRVRQILDMGIPVEVHVSINGTEATHDATRGKRGFWKKAVYLLETLNSAGVPVGVAMSLMPQTIADLPYMQQFCAERNIKLLYSWVRQYDRYGEVDQNYSTWPEELKPKLKQIEYLPDVFDCPGLSKRLVITPEGSVYPCEVYHPEILLGNVNEQSLEQILNSQRTASIMRMISNKDCYWCQGAGEKDGSPKWMLMDCYRRHSAQTAYLAENYPQAVNMLPQESKHVIENIINHPALNQAIVADKYEKIETIKDDNNNKQIRISAVVCTYRNPALLAKTLDSLSRQTLDKKLYEVIVVDNNSQDNTKGVVDKYPLFRYVFEEQLGLSPARNTGIRAAVGKIVAFIDDDSVAEPNWLKALLDTYDKYPDAWAVGGKILLKWEAQPPEWLTEKYHIRLGLRDLSTVLRQLNWPERLAGSNCSFKKEVFYEVGYFKSELGRIGNLLLACEEVYIQKRIYQEQHSVYYNPDAVVYHHVPPSKMNKVYFANNYLGHLISKVFIELFEKDKTNEVCCLVSKFRDIRKNLSTESFEIIEEPFLESIYSSFLQENSVISVNLKEQFLSQVIKYYLELRKFEKVIRKCYEWLAIPNISASLRGCLLLRLVDLHLRQNKIKQAQKMFYEAINKCLLVHMEVNQTLSAFAEYYKKQGRFLEFKKMLDTILAFEHIPEQNKVILIRCSGEIYAEYQMYKEAEQIYQSIFPFNNLELKNQDKLLLGLGQLYQKSGKYSEARQAFYKALEIEAVMKRGKLKLQQDSNTSLTFEKKSICDDKTSPKLLLSSPETGKIQAKAKSSLYEPQNPTKIVGLGKNKNIEIAKKAQYLSETTAAQLTKSQRIDALYDKIRANSSRILMQNKDKYRGRRCVIIGNGPSLNNTDLSLLKNEYTFGLNKIYLLFDRIDWRPTFYACVNPFVIEQSGQQILNEIPGLKFLDFASFKYLPCIEDIVYLLSSREKGFSTNPCEVIFQSHTVTYVAMQLAYYLGFDEVFLIGVDHFYGAAKKGVPNQVVTQDEPDNDHFDPNYFEKGCQWHLPDLKGSEQGYRLARETYEKAGKKIYDATVGGHLSVFEKVDFYDVFGKTENPSLYTSTPKGLITNH